MIDRNSIVKKFSEHHRNLKN